MKNRIASAFRTTLWILASTVSGIAALGETAPVGSVEVGAPAYKVHGISFSPYIDGDEDPNLGEGQITPMELQSRVELVAPFTRWIRTFGCNADLREIGRLAHQLGLESAIGAWIDGDPVEDQKQIDCLIEEALEGHVDIAIVGSETLLRGTISEAEVIQRIQEVRQALQSAALDIPVTTADVYGILLSHPTVIEAVDLVFVNYYPYWEGRSLDLAVAHLHLWHQQMNAAAGGKEVIVSETGWPSCGDQIGEALPSPDNAAFYFLVFASWAQANSVKYFYFESFDESWKAGLEGPQGACWGVWNGSGVSKAGMEKVFDGETVPDNWSAPPPTEPIIDFRELPDVTETNLSAFLVTGSAATDDRILLNGSPLPTEARDDEGNFAAAVPLAEGENVIELRIETLTGESVSQDLKTVIRDSTLSTHDRRLVYVDIVDVDDDRPVLSGTAVVDLDGNTLLGLLGSQHVRGISLDGEELYLHDNTVISTDSHRVLRILPFSQEIPSNGFVAAGADNRLYSRDEIVDLAANQLLPDRLPRSLETFGSWSGAPIPGDPAISTDGRFIYCCSEVAKIDAATFMEVGRRGTSSAFETDLALTPDETKVLVADYSFSTGRLKSYSPDDLESLLDSVTGLGDFVGEIALSSNGDRAVVGSAGNPASPTDGRLSVVDLSSWQILDQENVPLGDNLAVSDNNELIVSSGQSGLFRRLGIQVFILEPAGNLVRSKTFFFGINRFVTTSGRPRNDRIRKLVFKPRCDIRIFADSFESGDTLSWSIAVP